MFFWNKICVVCFFFFISAKASAQVTFNTSLKEKDFILKNSVKLSGYPLHFITSTIGNQPVKKINNWSVNNGITQDYYTRNFGFFCKQELRVEKAIKFPLRFRLGSLQQCNYYEGKN